jgi:hypothetical protein
MTQIKNVLSLSLRLYNLPLRLWLRVPYRSRGFAQQRCVCKEQDGKKEFGVLMTKSNYYRTIDRTGQIAPKVNPSNRKSLHGQRNNLAISHELCVSCFLFDLLTVYFQYLIIFNVIVVRFNICLLL